MSGGLTNSPMPLACHPDKHTVVVVWIPTPTPLLERRTTPPAHPGIPSQGSKDPPTDNIFGLQFFSHCFEERLLGFCGGGRVDCFRLTSRQATHKRTTEHRLA